MRTENAVIQLPATRDHRKDSSKRRISKTKRKRLKSRALLLQSQGRTHAEIAEELGIARSTVATLVPKKIAVPEDAISGPALVRWIESHSEEDPYAGLLVKGTPLTSSQQRALFRWREENVNPRLGTVESYLASWADTLFAEFENWAETHGVMIWACGQAPSWWEDASNSREVEDLASSDPEWVAEARARGVTRPEHSQVLVAA